MSHHHLISTIITRLIKYILSTAADGLTGLATNSLSRPFLAVHRWASVCLGDVLSHSSTILSYSSNFTVQPSFNLWKDTYRLFLLLSLRLLVFFLSTLTVIKLHFFFLLFHLSAAQYSSSLTYFTTYIYKFIIDQKETKLLIHRK